MGLREVGQMRRNLTWQALVFAMLNDGTASRPLLLHVIMNDDKSSSCTLGLQGLVDIADTALDLARAMSRTTSFRRPDRVFSTARSALGTSRYPGCAKTKLVLSALRFVTR